MRYIRKLRLVTLFYWFSTFVIFVLSFVFLQLELWSARSHDGLAKPKTFFVCFSFHFVILWPLSPNPSSNKSKYSYFFCSTFGACEAISQDVLLRYTNCETNSLKKCALSFCLSLLFPFFLVWIFACFPSRRISEGLLIENHSWQTSDHLARPHYLLDITFRK